MEIATTLPVLPIRNAVVFPGASMPLVVGRPRSIRAVNLARESDSLILVITQRVMSAGDPNPNDMYMVGTLCRIDSTVETESGSYQLVISGISRYRVIEFKEGDYLAARG